MLPFKPSLQWLSGARVQSEALLAKGLLATVPLRWLEKAMGIAAPLKQDGRVMDRYTRLACEVSRYKPRLWKLPVAETRTEYEKLVKVLDAPFPSTVTKCDQVVSLHSKLAGRRDIRLRFYKKKQENKKNAHAKNAPWQDASGQRRPIMVFYHGGGWVIGSVDSTDRLCAMLCHELDHIIVSVDYRLNPEYPFPAAQHDAIDAFSWVQARATPLGGDPETVYVAGDSAGGQLAAVVAQQTLLLQRPAPCLQVLIYPSLDRRQPGRSHHSLGQGYLLDRPMLDWFMTRFLADESRFDDLLASPLRAQDELIAKLPKAIIVTAGFDLLRDEGDLYAQRLRKAGIQVIYQEQAGLAHGFVTMTGVIPTAKRAILEMIEQISDNFAKL